MLHELQVVTVKGGKCLVGENAQRATLLNVLEGTAWDAGVRPQLSCRDGAGYSPSVPETRW